MKVILIIENDDTDAALVTLVARDAATHVQALKNVEQARDYLERKGIYQDRHQYPLPSLLVLGIQSLDAAVLEFLEWLRQAKEFRSLRILAWSPEHLDGQIQKMLDAGVSVQLLKSPSTAQLRRAIEALLTQAN